MDSGNGGDKIHSSSSIIEGAHVGDGVPSYAEMVKGSVMVKLNSSQIIHVKEVSHSLMWRSLIRELRSFRAMNTIRDAFINELARDAMLRAMGGWNGVNTSLQEKDELIWWILILFLRIIQKFRPLKRNHLPQI